MSKLFGKTKSTINEHVKNIYKNEELVESDKPTNYYNLDMIISVGYCVNSKQGIIFRILWFIMIVINLLTVQSNSKEKNVLVDLVMNFLCK